MASTYFRKLKVLASKFPCKSHIKRLSKVKDTKDIGVFTIDRCRIVIQEHWTVEDCPGSKSKKSVPQYCKKGLPNGYLHHLEHRGHKYQVYQNRGANRAILINPRHFDSYEEFKEFTLELIDSRPYRINGLDLSWMLYKKLFSIDFLFWSLWYKGAAVFDPMPVRSQIDRIISKCEMKEFRFGKKPIVGKAYDCDAHNEDKDRNESWKMHNCINLELALGSESVKALSVDTLEDLERFKFIGDALRRVEFLKPSKSCFKNTRFEDLYLYWQKQGATSMMRKLNDLSGTNNYERLYVSYMSPLMIGEQTMKESLTKLAREDWQKFKTGRLEVHRYQTRHVGYDMAPLFD